MSTRFLDVRTIRLVDLAKSEEVQVLEDMFADKW